MLRFTVPVNTPIRLNADIVTVVHRTSFREFRIRHGGKEYAISKYTEAKLMIDGHVVAVTTAPLALHRAGAECVAIGIDAPRAIKIERPR